MDPDIFALLYPCRGEGYDGASYAISMPENGLRFRGAKASSTGLEPSADRQERGETVLPEERGALEKTDALVCRLSDPHRTGTGLVLGCDPNADIVIQPWPGISRSHLALTFDEKGWPIARDLGSSGGTIVTYDEEKGRRRSNFLWQLRGPEILHDQALVLNLTDLVQFLLVIPAHDVVSVDYRRRVAEFHNRTAEPEDLFASLRVLSGPITQLPTGMHTPLTPSIPIFYKKVIGMGRFGVVTYVWNVTTREKYVVKEPMKDRLTSLELRSWKQEARMMHCISHDHIVAFLDYDFSQRPWLKFEFVPGGSLDKQTGISTFESWQILSQLSSALEYLHEQKPQIAHRDIKPENILIASRADDSIFVKFADFGLSGAKEVLTTFCGTLQWAAPEIYLKIPNPVGAERYGVVIDVWSLGVVIGWLECGLPKYRKTWEKDTTAWPRAVLSHIQDYEHTYQQQGSDLLYFLLDTMLIEDPGERSSASYCHKAVSELTNCDSRIPFLQRIPNDGGARTARASMGLDTLDSLKVADSEDSGGDSEASTIRQKSQSDSSDKSVSRRQLRSTGDSPVQLTELDNELQEASRGASNPGADTWRQESVVHGLLWSVEGEDSSGPRRISQHPAEEHGITSLGRYPSGDKEAPGDGAQETVEARGTHAQLKQSEGKSTWPEGVRPSISRNFLLRERRVNEGKDPANYEGSKVHGPCKRAPAAIGQTREGVNQKWATARLGRTKVDAVETDFTVDEHRKQPLPDIAIWRPSAKRQRLVEESNADRDNKREQLEVLRADNIDSFKTEDFWALYNELGNPSISQERPGTKELSSSPGIFFGLMTSVSHLGTLDSEIQHDGRRSPYYSKFEMEKSRTVEEDAKLNKQVDLEKPDDDDHGQDLASVLPITDSFIVRHKGDFVHIETNSVVVRSDTIQDQVFREDSSDVTRNRVSGQPLSMGTLDFMPNETEIPSLADKRHIKAQNTGDVHEMTMESLSGYSYVFIGIQSIAIRNADRYVNATHMFKAAGKSRRDLSDLKHEMRYEAVSEGSRWSGTYVALSDALMYCWTRKWSSISDVLEEFARKSMGNDMLSKMIAGNGVNRVNGSGELKPFQGVSNKKGGFRYLVIRDQQIAVNETNSTINLSHIFRAAGQRKDKLGNWKSEHPEFEYKVVKGAPKLQGTYVPFRDALNICCIKDWTEIVNLLQTDVDRR